MNEDRWEQIIYKIEEKFGLENRWTEEFEVEETHRGEKIMGSREIVEFNSPLGKIQIERISRPKIIDKKILSSKRIGNRAVVDYIYSDEVRVSQTKFKKYNPDSQLWEEMDSANFDF